MSYDVTLPVAQRPIFPDLCPVCGLQGVDGVISLRGARGVIEGPWSMLPGGMVEAAIPSHKRCAARFNRGVWVTRTLDFGAALIAGLLAEYIARTISPGLTRGWRTGWFMVGAVSALVARAVWELLHPPPVEITVWNKKMDYEFSSRSYAEAFAVANGLTPEDVERSP